jgi:2-C-methyl-D-erythritol 4-phosphate cytidylyltransferase/2-C-methyl-D-erythritol 2,4-cyclodiphosphate synthase
LRLAVEQRPPDNATVIVELSGFEQIESFNHMRVAAIIAAAGQGLRFGGVTPKQFVELEGKSLLERSVEAFARSSRIDRIVVALPALMCENPPSFLATVAKPTTFVAGGANRSASVANAFAAVPESTDVVVIHDAARPFVSDDLINRTIDAASAHGAAIAAIPARDTVKQVDRREPRTISTTLPRDTIFLAQTPQAFRRDVLARALGAAGAPGAAGAVATDEAMLVERTGFKVHIVEGEVSNIKVTTPEDLATGARAVRGTNAAAPTIRIGTGYDLHRLVGGRPLILAGVRIPFERGLDGHSDADIVCHAVTDAILGAAAIGDIGRLFPDNDAQWKDADSIELLRGAMDAVRRAGYAVSNVDVTVIAERPKLLPYLDAMRANLAGALGVDASAVSIKGKTNEKVDAIGKGDAMACHAVALLTGD